MNLQAWRIVRRQLAATAFDGEGARIFGGYWNSPGTRVVYTSGTRALAALETLVHLNSPVHFRYVIVPVEFDARLVETIDPSHLPADWAIEPPRDSTKRIGDRWARDGRSAVLALPSVIIPSETNYLLNPTHRDFKRITIGNPAPFAFDSRLL